MTLFDVLDTFHDSHSLYFKRMKVIQSLLNVTFASKKGQFKININTKNGDKKP